MRKMEEKDGKLFHFPPQEVDSNDTTVNSHDKSENGNNTHKQIQKYFLIFYT